MNLQLIGIKTAALAVGAVVASTIASPAQAAGVRGSISFTSTARNLVNEVTPTRVDFNNNPGVFSVNDGTGDFASLIGNGITFVSDINLNAFTGNQQLFTIDGGPSFTVTEFINPTFTNINRGLLASEVRGFFASGSSSTRVSPSSFFVAVNARGSLDDQVDFSLQTVPTPALLPGLVGMGIAALRKRKSEEETVEEAVEV